MKRDMDLIRKLLFFFDEREEKNSIECPPIEGYSEREIMYHMVLITEAGFLAAEPTRSNTSERIVCVLGFQLTWDGHEFLDAIRDDNLWTTAKKKFAECGTSIAFDLVQAWALQEAKSRLGL